MLRYRPFTLHRQEAAAVPLLLLGGKYSGGERAFGKPLAPSPTRLRSSPRPLPALPPPASPGSRAGSAGAHRRPRWLRTPPPPSRHTRPLPPPSSRPPSRAPAHTTPPAAFPSVCSLHRTHTHILPPACNSHQWGILPSRWCEIHCTRNADHACRTQPDKQASGGAASSEAKPHPRGIYNDRVLGQAVRLQLTHSPNTCGPPIQPPHSPPQRLRAACV